MTVTMVCTVCGEELEGVAPRGVPRLRRARRRFRIKIGYQASGTSLC